MDNASRALTIAGGILIGTLLISLAMYFRTVLQDVTTRSYDMIDSSQITAYNSHFTKYGPAGIEIPITGADAWNILSFVDNTITDINKDAYSVIGNIQCMPSSTINNTNYRNKFFFADAISDKKNYKFVYECRADGLVDRVSIYY